MTPQIRNLVLAALTAALPLAVSAQSGTSGTSTSGSSQTSSETDTSRAGSSQSGSMQGSPSQSGTTGSSSSSTSLPSFSSTSGGAAGLGSISRVDQDSLDQQFTATDLIGKEVYDNSGKKVGEIKDIVLGSAAGSHLAMAFASSQSGARSGTSGTAGSGTGAAGSTGSTYGSTGTTGSADRTARTSTGSASGSRTADTGSGERPAGIGAAADRMMSQAHGAMSGLTAEPAAVVSVGGFMGMGDNLLRVPLSQLSYDSSNERLTLAVSETEITSMTDRSESRSVAE